MGNPLPVKKNRTALPQGSRAGAGVLVARAREGRNRGRRSWTLFSCISCTALLSPTPPAPSALLPRPKGGGSSRDIPRKDLPGMPAPIPPSPRTIPCTGPWGYHQGWGSGRELPPRRREPYRPSYRAPAQERGFSGKEPGRGAAGGETTSDTILLHFIHRSPIPHPARASRSSPFLWGGGSAGNIPRKGRPGEMIRSYPSPASSRTPDRGGSRRVTYSTRG